MESKKDSLTKEELKKFGKEVVLYGVVPVAIVFLTVIQNHGSLVVAIGAAESAAVAAAINLLRKYSQGV
jgi:mevalonate pyrophosphate decarboxylase